MAAPYPVSRQPKFTLTGALQLLHPSSLWESGMICREDCSFIKNKREFLLARSHNHITTITRRLCPSFIVKDTPIIRNVSQSLERSSTTVNATFYFGVTSHTKVCCDANIRLVQRHINAIFRDGKDTFISGCSHFATSEDIGTIRRGAWLETCQ